MEVKRLIFWTLTLVIISCQRDVSVGCEGSPGKLCRSIHYIEGKLNKTVDYEYPTGQKVVKINSNKSGVKLSTEELIFSDGLLISRVVNSEGEPEQLKENYTYQEGKLKTFSQYRDGRAIFLERIVEDNLPIAEELRVDGELVYSAQTEYEDQDTVKFITQFYDAFSNLDSIHEFRWYGSQYHITRSNSAGLLLSVEIQFYEDSLLIRRRVTTSSQEFFHYWSYDGKQLESYRVEQNGEEIYFVEYLYP